MEQFLELFSFTESGVQSPLARRARDPLSREFGDTSLQSWTNKLSLVAPYFSQHAMWPSLEKLLQSEGIFCLKGIAA